MKRTRLLSALLAVMMVISMIACIAVPAVAEVGTLPADAVSVTTVTAAVEGAQNYKIETVADLVYVMNNASYFDVEDTIYLANDINTEDYEGGTAAFKTAYEAATCTGTTAFYPSIDGLGHTIYNYHANRSVFANHSPRNNGFIKNISFVNAEAATTSHQGLVVYRPELSVKNNATTIMENIHVKNAKISSGSGHSASVFGYINTGDIKNVVIRNCSVIDTEVTSTSTYGVGILVGRARTDGVLTLENILIAGCTLNNTGKGTEGGGLVVGDSVADDPNTGSTVFKNVGVFNNTTVLSKDTVAGTGASLLTTAYGKSGSTTTKISIDGIYAAGNKIQLSDNSLVDFDRLISQGKNGVNLTSYTNYKSDTATSVMERYDDSSSTAAAAGTVDATYNVAGGLADLNASATYADWGFAANGAATLLEPNEKAPVAVSFTKKDVTTTYYTDVNGKIAVNAAFANVSANELAALAEAAWSDGTNEVAKGADWANMTFTAATAYTKTSHDLSYTAGANNTHDVVCDICDAHTVTGVACTPVAVPENDVAASYFAKAKKAYKCEFCTNTWFEDDADSTFAAPYTLTFDQEGYRNNDTEVKVTLTPKADANMSGMNLDLAFSADYLDYVEYAPSAATVVVNEVTEGNLVIAMVKADGTTLTEADAITLTFKVQGLSNSVINAALTATATLTKATVGTGNDFAVAEALTKTVTATSAASYLDFEAGDVNSDGFVDLLDAVLIIQKLNGTIGTAQDAAFKLIAADVNNSGDVNTADITLVLQYVCEMDVTFTPAMQEPTIVVVGA